MNVLIVYVSHLMLHDFTCSLVSCLAVRFVEFRFHVRVTVPVRTLRDSRLALAWLTQSLAVGGRPS